jgi:uncharacterized protein
MEPCKIEWLTIPAPDLQAAKAFYEAVFGFSVSKFSERFWVFKSGSLSGGLDADLEPNGKGIGFSITVPEIASWLKNVVSNGGSIDRPGYSLGPGAGYCARFLDPNGNLLELYAEILNSDSQQADPADRALRGH